MIKLAGIEDSGVTDRVTGKRIYVTVTARKKFRLANPTWSKVRNKLLNTAIATDFARSKPQAKYFKVRSDPHSIGQVRDGFGGQYIAIIDSNSAKVITVGKGGTPKLSAPAPASGQIPAPVSMSPAPVALSNTEFQFFIVKHAVDNIADTLELSNSRLNDVIDLLSERTGISVSDLVKRLESGLDKETSDTLSLLCIDTQADYLHVTEDKNSFITDPVYETNSDLPSSAFTMQTGLAQR